jgi:large subunit ribosomal protein L15
MSFSLNTIKPAKGAVRAKKRVARGNASGHGTTGTRGQKGQKSRSGVTGLKRLGMRKLILSMPKRKGFKSLRSKPQIVNLSDLNGKFKDSDTLNVVVLAKKRLIDQANGSVKILGQGGLQAKNLKIEKNILLSKSAKEAIEKAGGKILDNK